MVTGGGEIAELKKRQGPAPHIQVGPITVPKVVANLVAIVTFTTTEGSINGVSIRISARRNNVLTPRKNFSVLGIAIHKEEPPVPLLSVTDG